jgi:hypothetical protein
MPRKIIDRSEYLKTQAALMSLVEKTPKFELVPGSHNINLIPEGLNIYYISKEYMASFEPFAPYDIRTHKMVNYGTPAVELNFYWKHKYFVDTKRTEKEIFNFLAGYQKDLEDEKNELLKTIKKVYVLDLSEDAKNRLIDSYQSSMENLQNQQEYWEKVNKNLSNMEWVISNYEHGFHYYELGFKYWDSPLSEYVSYNSHMIKNQFNKNGELTQERHNIIFVDETAIQYPIANQHKTVENLLASFTQQIQLGIKTIYFKNKF